MDTYQQITHREQIFPNLSDTTDWLKIGEQKKRKTRSLQTLKSNLQITDIR